MLKLADYRSRAKGLPDLLPYAALVAPGVILNKNVSFLAAWEVRQLLKAPKLRHLATTKSAKNSGHYPFSKLN